MKRILIGTIAAVFPFTASFAAGVNVNLHDVGVAKTVSLSALPALGARANTLGRLPGFTASPALTLPGIPKLPVSLPSTGAPNGWLPYDVHVWPQQVGGYLFHSGGYIRDGVKQQIIPMLQGDLNCDVNPDCGGANNVEQEGFDLFGALSQIIIGAGVIVVPRPRFPPAIEGILGGGGGGG